MSKLNPKAKTFFPSWWNKEENKVESKLNPNTKPFFPRGLNPNAKSFFPKGLNPNAEPFEPELPSTSRFIQPEKKMWKDIIDSLDWDWIDFYFLLD